jgi:hypothetical protein
VTSRIFKASQYGGSNWHAITIRALVDGFKVTLAVGGRDTVLTVTKRRRTLYDISTATFNKFWWRYYPPGFIAPLYPNVYFEEILVATCYYPEDRASNLHIPRHGNLSSHLVLTGRPGGSHCRFVFVRSQVQLLILQPVISIDALSGFPLGQFLE